MSVEAENDGGVRPSSPSKDLVSAAGGEFKEIVGSLLFQNQQIAHFASLDSSDLLSQSLVTERMMRTAVHFWELREPKLIISIITGGAKESSEIDIHNEQLLKTKLLPGLMKLAEAADVWFLTHGMDEGIVKMLGRARIRFGGHAPLIGVANWDEVFGKDEIARGFPESATPEKPIPGALGWGNGAAMPCNLKEWLSDRFALSGLTRAKFWDSQTSEGGNSCDDDDHAQKKRHGRRQPGDPTLNKPKPRGSKPFRYQGANARMNPRPRLSSREEESPRNQNQHTAAPRHRHLEPNHSHLFLLRGPAGPEHHSFHQTVTRSFEAKLAKFRPQVVLLCFQGGPDAAESLRNAVELAHRHHDEQQQDAARALGKLSRRCSAEDVRSQTQTDSSMAREPSFRHAQEAPVGVLVVKGSGQTADLVADLVLCKHVDSEEHGRQPMKTMSAAHAMLSALLRELGFDPNASTSGPQELFSGDCYLACLRKLKRVRSELGLRVGNRNTARLEDVDARLPGILHVLSHYWPPHASRMDASSPRGLGGREDEEGARDLSCAELEHVLELVTGFYDAMFVAQKEVCLVHEMGSTLGEDIGSSTLRCAINAIGHDDTTQLSKKLRLAVEFNNLEVLESVVKTTELQHTNQEKLRKAINSALQAALTKLNRHALVEFLANNGATIDNYNPHAADPDTRRTARLNWKELLSLIPNTVFRKHKIFPMFSGAEEAVPNRLRVVRDGSGDVTEQSGGGTETVLARDETGECQCQQCRKDLPLKEVSRAEKMKRWSSARWFPQGRPAHANPATNSRRSSSQAVINLGNNLMARLVGGEECKSFIKRFEQWVVRRMGNSFQYKMAQISPEFDLMLYSALMNDRQLTFMWWKKYGHPTRSALTVCRLYRSLMASSMPPSELNVLGESADFFEKLATEVHLHSRVESHFLSSANLECPMRIWCGQTCLDVAVLGESDTFVAECCKEEIEKRFAGDLLPIQEHIWSGFKLAVFCNVLLFGLLAPFSVQYNKSPLSDTLRFPTQNMPQDEFLRRKEEYKRPMQIYGDEEAFIRRREVEGQGQWYMGTEWSKHIADRPLLERYSMWFWRWWLGLKLFWQAPITLFISDAIILFCVNLTFSIFLFLFADKDSTGPEVFEIGMACYFGCRMCSEAVQAWVTPWRDYVYDFWNVLDCTSVLFFVAAFALRSVCPSHREHCENQLWESGIPIDRMWEFYYSVCLFLLWTRLLRVFSCSESLGPLVILIRRMGADIFRFALIYAVLLVGFSILLRGSTPGDYQLVCSNDDEELSKVRCWGLWMIIRTFIQATGGDLFLNEVTTDASMGGVVLLFLVLNLLMLNLAIAIMSNTYERFLQEAERQYLVDLYQLTREYSRQSVVAPMPFNVIFMLCEVAVYFQYRDKFELCNLWRGQQEHHIFDLFLRRNRPIDEIIIRELYSRECMESSERTSPQGEEKGSVQPDKDGKDEQVDRRGVRKRLAKYRGMFVTRKHLQMDLEISNCWANKLNAFMERGRTALMQTEEFFLLLGNFRVQASSQQQPQDSDSPTFQSPPITFVTSVAPVFDNDNAHEKGVGVAQLASIPKGRLSSPQTLPKKPEDQHSIKIFPGKAMIEARAGRDKLEIDSGHVPTDLLSNDEALERGRRQRGQGQEPRMRERRREHDESAAEPSDIDVHIDADGEEPSKLNDSDSEVNLKVAQVLKSIFASEPQIYKPILKKYLSEDVRRQLRASSSQGFSRHDELVLTISRSAGRRPQDSEEGSPSRAPAERSRSPRARREDRS